MLYYLLYYFQEEKEYILSILSKLIPAHAGAAEVFLETYFKPYDKLFFFISRAKIFLIFKNNLFLMAEQIYKISQFIVEAEKR